MAYAPKKKNGVLLANNDTVLFKLIDKCIDDKGRFIILVAEVHNVPYTLFTLYAPNQHPIRFFRKLSGVVKRMQKGSVIIDGYFNAVMNVSMDSSSHTLRQRQSLLL